METTSYLRLSFIFFIAFSIFVYSKYAFRNTNLMGPPQAGSEGKRIVKVHCFSKQGTPNFFMRPIEGLTITVDTDHNEIIKFVDTGRCIPIPKSSNTNYRYSAQERPLQGEPLNPISIEQSKGLSFRVEDGHIVKWANWVFHLKPNRQTGMTIS